MSSRYGERVAGTDGTDFKHREKVAGHYKTSVTNKFRLKLTLMMHGLLYCLLLVRMAADIFGLFDLTLPVLPDLPDAKPWEYLWMGSIVGVGLCYASLNKSNEFILRCGYYAIFSFALLPILYGIGVTTVPLLNFVRGEEEESEIERFAGFPMVLLYFIFFTVALQVHIFSLYFALQLLRIWAPVVSKKKE